MRTLAAVLIGLCIGLYAGIMVAAEVHKANALAWERQLDATYEGCGEDSTQLAY